MTKVIHSGRRKASALVKARAGRSAHVMNPEYLAEIESFRLMDDTFMSKCLENAPECRTAPVLNVSGKTVTFGSESNVVVKVSAADGIRAKGGKYTLTSGGKFANTNVSFAPGCPDWVKGVSVVEGEIVLKVKDMGMTIFVK